MKRFKNVSFVLSAIMLAGCITFSACKKDKDDNEAIGKKAANEMCGCLTEMMMADEDDEDAGADCMLNFVGNYNKYITFDSKSDMGFKFTDADFEKGFMAQIINCEAAMD